MAGRMGPVGTKRKGTGREEDVMGRRKKGLGVTVREEGSDEGGIERSLKVLVTNVRDLKSGTKLEELQLLAEGSGFDVVAITESWANSSIDDAEVALEGFRLFRKDREREVEQKGGGVLLYVRNEIVACELTEIRNGKCEAVWIQARNHKGVRICIGNCYRSPTASKEENEALLEAIRLAAAKEKCFLLVGDFNYPGIDWQEMSASGDGERFMDIVQDNFLHQHVKQATRGANILDLVISSEEDLVDDLRIGSPIGGSDHASIEFRLNLSWRVKEENNIGLDYRKADYVSIVREMVEIDWNERFRGKEVNGMWLEFRSIVDELKEKHVPRFTGNRRRKQKWMDYGACKAVKKKYKAWRRFTDTPGYQSYEEFKKARNKATTELRRAKRKFEEKLAEGIKKDSKSFYRYVKSKVGTKEKIGPLKDDNGNVLTDVESMGELLNRFFASVFSREQGGGDINVEESEDDQAEMGSGGGEGIRY